MFVSGAMLFITRNNRRLAGCCLIGFYGYSAVAELENSSSVGVFKLLKKD